MGVLRCSLSPRAHTGNAACRSPCVQPVRSYNNRAITTRATTGYNNRGSTRGSAATRRRPQCPRNAPVECQLCRRTVMTAHVALQGARWGARATPEQLGTGALRRGPITIPMPTVVPTTELFTRHSIYSLYAGCQLGGSRRRSSWRYLYVLGQAPCLNTVRSRCSQLGGSRRRSSWRYLYVLGQAPCLNTVRSRCRAPAGARRRRRSSWRWCAATWTRCPPGWAEPMTRS